MVLPKILIVGATGAVGRLLLRELLSLPDPPSIRVSTRNPAKLDLPPSVEVVKGDLNDVSSYHQLFEGIDRAYLYAVPEAPLERLFMTAKNCNVRHVVLLSSLSAEMDPEGVLGKTFCIVEDGVKRAGLQYTFLRAGSFSSNTLLFWMPQIQEMGRLWMTCPDTQMAPISEIDIARAAVVALTTDKLINKAVRLTGPSCKTHQDQLDDINRLRHREGKDPFESIIVPAEVWKAKTSDFIVPDLQDQLIKFWEEGQAVSPKIYSSESITGMPSESFEEWLESHKEMFLGD
ncbi:hypothetical protein Plec18167_009111 [Paecilomyces lecythidis]|uniref:NAD(P)-binding domain-containing protein n=1 Tax=Paecilomyces lecythidis TaxID=3004212 RepID=A0ABR3WRJ4_9EURO